MRRTMGTIHVAPRQSISNTVVSHVKFIVPALLVLTLPSLEWTHGHTRFGRVSVKHGELKPVHVYLLMLSPVEHSVP